MILNQMNIVLTGASRDPGTSIARACWRAGANLLLVARSKEGLDNLRAECIRAPVREKQSATIFVADLSKEDAALAIVNKAISHWSAVHALINTAAIPGPVGPAWETDWRDWESMLRVNLLAPVEICRAFAPWMIDQKGGSIINVTGGDSRAFPDFCAYETAKAGLVRFTEVLAKELQDTAVRANTVAFSEDNISTTTAELCAFLSSDDARGITGRFIHAATESVQELSSHADEFRDSDLFTLRRINAEDRGFKW